MGIGKFVKGTINVVATAAKVTVELGADAIGAIAEKVDDNPESKEKYKNIGKKLGQDIKNNASKLADSSEGIVENVVDSGIKVCKEFSEEVSEKINSVKDKKSDKTETTTYSYTVKNEEVDNVSKNKDNKAPVVDVNFQEVNNENNYGVIKLDNDKVDENN